MAEKKIEFEYPDENMATWETLWGKDFISPGGADEVREIVRQEDLEGKAILDIGSGWGGPAFLFAQELGAKKVVGIDFQSKCVDKATRRAAELGIGDKVEFQTVSSVHWDFLGESFDVVFSKDAILHTEDKDALFSEVLRVLKPGGRFVVADWFGSDQAPTAEMKGFKQDNPFALTLISLGQTVDVLVRLGFDNVSVKDRTDWFQRIFQQDIVTLKGSKGVELVGTVGAERFQELLRTWFEPCAILSQQGQLRLGRFYASRPVGGATSAIGAQSGGS